MRGLVLMCVVLSGCNGKAEMIHGFSYERVRANECLHIMESAMREIDPVLDPHDSSALSWLAPVSREQWNVWQKARVACWTTHTEKEHTP
jgi:hypothetical protein